MVTLKLFLIPIDAGNSGRGGGFIWSVRTKLDFFLSRVSITATTTFFFEKVFKECIFNSVLVFFRNCIGQHFAMNEMKVTLAQVLRQFKLEWDSSRPPIAMNVGITLLPEGGVPIIVKRLAK